VLVGAPVLLVHCATGAPLHLEEGWRFPTDFGSEHEVTGHAATKPLLAQNLEAVVKVGDGLGGLMVDGIMVDRVCLGRQNGIP
jgi:hypothetical protein